METYLESTLEYKAEVQKQYCETCDNCVEVAAEAAYNEDTEEEATEDDYAQLLRQVVPCQNVDTSSCYAECQNIENMEENGYMDASEFIGCEKLDYKDNYGNEYYSGAMCASYGTRIKIEIFSDEECSVYAESQELESYLKNGDG